jgi:hypothetical protein
MMLEHEAPQRKERPTTAKTLKSNKSNKALPKPQVLYEDMSIDPRFEDFVIKGSEM